MIFGGRGHTEYLGCLNCEAWESDSILNESGRFGHCPTVFDDNLFCRGVFKEFGESGPFKNFSACSEYASDPPVIVDQNGRYYGRFSVGGVWAHRVAVCCWNGGFADEPPCRAVKWVCKQ